MNKKVFTLLFVILSLISMKSLAEDLIIDINAGEINIMGSVMSVPDFEKWYYFSFETGTVVGTSDFTLENVNAGGIGTEVPSAEWALRTDWDIAFHATDIRTNGAKALLIADTTSITPLATIYENLIEAQSTNYTTDEVVEGVFIQSLASMPPLRATQMSVCKVAHGWTTFGMTSAPTNSMVVVLELANANYVKVYLKDFYNEDGEPGYISMEYAEIAAPENAGINDQTVAKFNIYPNPATETLNLNLTVQATTIVIYNLNGSVVKGFSAQVGINSISIGDLQTGIYFIKVDNQVRKFVVKF